MNNYLTISEITENLDINKPELINKRLKITNTSTQFINNIQLIIDADKLPICEKSIIRTRGSLSLDPSIQCLELGNLAPNETAYFEYKFHSPSNLSSLCEHFSIRYCNEQATFCTERKISDYLHPSSPLIEELSD